VNDRSNAKVDIIMFFMIFSYISKYTKLVLFKIRVLISYVNKNLFY
jgi:hypothetical protein